MNFDGTYTITEVADLRRADIHALKRANQLHFIQHRTSDRVVQWVGEHTDTMCWCTPINPIQAKTAQLLFMVDQ